MRLNADVQYHITPKVWCFLENFGQRVLPIPNTWKASIYVSAHRGARNNIIIVYYACIRCKICAASHTWIPLESTKYFQKTSDIVQIAYFHILHLRRIPSSQTTITSSRYTDSLSFVVFVCLNREYVAHVDVCAFECVGSHQIPLSLSFSYDTMDLQVCYTVVITTYTHAYTNQRIPARNQFHIYMNEERGRKKILSRKIKISNKIADEQSISWYSFGICAFVNVVIAVALNQYTNSLK